MYSSIVFTNPHPTDATLAAPIAVASVLTGIEIFICVIFDNN